VVVLWGGGGGGGGWWEAGGGAYSEHRSGYLKYFREDFSVDMHVLLVPEQPALLDESRLVLDEGLPREVEAEDRLGQPNRVLLNDTLEEAPHRQRDLVARTHGKRTAKKQAHTQASTKGS